MSATEREIEHTVEATTDGQMLANLSEEQRSITQMRMVRWYTIREGIIKLPVVRIATAHNSHNWVVDVEHPILGEHRIFIEKDMTHNPDSKLNTVLNWYKVEHPHELNTEMVVVDIRPDRWELVEPPWYVPSKRERIKRRVETVVGWLPELSVPKISVSMSGILAGVITLIGFLTYYFILTDIAGVVVFLVYMIGAQLIYTIGASND